MCMLKFTSEIFYRICYKGRPTKEIYKMTDSFLSWTISNSYCHKNCLAYNRMRDIFTCRLLRPTPGACAIKLFTAVIYGVS